MSEPFHFRIAVPGIEWWYHAAAIVVLLALTKDEQYTIESGGRGATLTIEVRGEVTLEEEDGLLVETTMLDILGDFTFATIERGMTVITARCDPRARARWQKVRDQVRDIAHEAREMRHLGVGSTPDEAIEYYYRVRAAGGKITMKQLAAKTGHTYEALKKHKQRYDAAGKWGSSKGT